MKVLGGDIGGTKTRLALFEPRGSRLVLIRENYYPSKQFDSLSAIIETFLASDSHTFERACFGIAGPVRNGICETTNFPWKINARDLSVKLGGKAVSLLNDLEANACGIAELTAGDFAVIQAGNSQAEGNAAVISAGTGLGEAGLYWDGARHRPFASEGGHCDFSPVQEIDLALLQYLSKRHGHVSWERVLSGIGLVNIHAFLCEYRKLPAPAWFEEEAKRTGDRGRVVTEGALSGKCPVCVEAIDLLVRFYGAKAGNLALTLMATGGIYLGGGIAPRIFSKLQSPVFLKAFLEKGRMQKILERIPVKVILNDRTALLGAGHFAAFGQTSVPAAEPSL